MEVEFVAVQNSNSQESTVSKNIPILGPQDLGNKGDSFSQQLKDIDEGLGIYEDPSIVAHAEVNNPQKETSPLYDLGSLGDDLDASQRVSRAPILVPPLHQTRVPPFHDISNILQVSENTDGTTQVKWKRLPRTVVGSLFTKAYSVGSKRPMDKAPDLSELPSKKILVFHSNKENQFVLAEVGSQPCQE